MKFKFNWYPVILFDKLGNPRLLLEPFVYQESPSSPDVEWNYPLRSYSPNQYLSPKKEK